MACRHYGVELIDISNPAKPKHISLVRTGEAQSVTARDGFLYVGVWASSEVVVVDVRNPWKPKITAREPLDGYGDGVDVDGSYLYAVTGHHSKERPRKNPGDPGFGRGHGLEIFDIQDPGHPKFVSRVKFPPLYEIGNDMWGVTVANGHAFVADTYNGSFVVDVGDPAEPQIVGRSRVPFSERRGKPGFVGGLSVVDDHIYLAGGYSDLHIVGAKGIAKTPAERPDAPPLISQPVKESELESGWRAYQPQGQVHAVSLLADDRAVVACGSAGVHLLKLWPEIRLLSILETDGFATDVSVAGTRIFVAEGNGGLSICEIPDGADRLHRLGRFLSPGNAVRQVEAPELGNRILIQAGANRFMVVNVEDPSAPRLVLEETRNGLLYGDQMMRGLVEDRYTCVFWHVSGLHWFDLKADPSPVYSGDNLPERIGSSNGLIAFKKKTLAMVRGGYVILDRSERRTMNEIGSTQVGTYRAHLGVPSLAGNRLYAAHRASGLITVADMSDPMKPKLIRQFTTSGNPSRIAVHRNSVIIPNGNNGLLVMEVTEGNPVR